MDVYLPGSVAVAQRYSRWHPAAILNNSFIHKIFIFHETEMKFGDNLPNQVPNDSIFANFSYYMRTCVRLWACECVLAVLDSFSYFSAVIYHRFLLLNVL